MNPLSDRINNLSTPANIGYGSFARELKAQGKISLVCLGNLTSIHPILLKKRQNALLTKISTYSPVEGYLELKEAICRKFKETMI
jgi:aspartate aminotransferase